MSDYKVYEVVGTKGLIKKMIELSDGFFDRHNIGPGRSLLFISDEVIEEVIEANPNTYLYNKALVWYAKSTLGNWKDLHIDLSYLNSVLRRRIVEMFKDVVIKVEYPDSIINFSLNLEDPVVDGFFQYLHEELEDVGDTDDDVINVKIEDHPYNSQIKIVVDGGADIVIPYSAIPGSRTYNTLAKPVAIPNKIVDLSVDLDNLAGYRKYLGKTEECLREVVDLLTPYEEYGCGVDILCNTLKDLEEE